MSSEPSTEAIATALRAAGAAHHDYESNFLEGTRDEHWAGWYAAFVLGRLGDVASPTELTLWLTEAPGDGDWASAAARYVTGKLATRAR